MHVVLRTYMYCGVWSLVYHLCHVLIGPLNVITYQLYWDIVIIASLVHKINDNGVLV